MILIPTALKLKLIMQIILQGNINIFNPENNFLILTISPAVNLCINSDPATHADLLRYMLA